MIEILSVYTLPTIILLILTVAMLKKIPIYEEFVEGAKDGFKISITIIPYLVAFIVAISMFRASGAIEYLSEILNSFLIKLNLTSDILPLMITRSFSGSATLGIFSEIVSTSGADSFISKLAAVMVGSSETTFYVLSIYFGSIGIKKFKYAILTGIIADITGIVLTIFVARSFFLANIG